MPFKTWLPSEALGGGAVDRLVADAIGAWSEHWFARRLMRGIGASAALDSGALGRLRHLQLRFSDGGLALALEDDAWVAIARLMLDEPADRHPQTPADEQLVERLAVACIEDLCARLAGTFGLAKSSSWRRGGIESLPFAEACVLAFGASETAPTIRILVANELVARIVRASARPGRKPPPLRPLAEALARQKIGLSAQVGGCSLSLGEFAGLSPGDVLVLDTAAESELPLAVDGVARPGRCTVERTDGQFRLKIVKPLTGKCP
jgi:hypothetical protein